MRRIRLPDVSAAASAAAAAGADHYLAASQRITAAAASAAALLPIFFRFLPTRLYKALRHLSISPSAGP